MTEKNQTPNIDSTIYDVPVSALREYRNNPRVGNVPAIAESLKANGQFRPIVVWRETHEILAGNHTWKAAKELGWETINVTYVENITEEQAKRIVLADNRSGELGTYDEKKLADLLESLENLDGTGYDSEYLDTLISGLQPEAETTYTDIDDIPDFPESPLTHIKEGQVWLLGHHRLICGDATDSMAYQRLLGDKQVDLVLTDPPYNVDYTGGTSEELTIQNDAMNETDFQDFLHEAFSKMIENTKPGGGFYIFFAIMKSPAFFISLEKAGWLLKQTLLWVKDRLVLSRQDYHWIHEPIMYGWKPGAAHYWEGGRGQTTVLYEKRPGQNKEHPTMKPVDLLTKLIRNSSPYRGTILDPFAGSGSTLIAAHTEGRQAYLMELDPRYADVIARRFQEHTGIIPVLEETGEPHDFTKTQSNNGKEE